MRKSRTAFFPKALLLAMLGGFLLLAGSTARAQVQGFGDVNLSQKAGADSECAIAKNPTDKHKLFALCNTAGAGLVAAFSTDTGAHWNFSDAADKTIADGDANQGPSACCDPSLTWDTFGNLFITYINNDLQRIETLISTDGGQTFANLNTIVGPCVQCVDQPTVVAANTTAPGAPVAVWIVWNQTNQALTAGSMFAQGAAVTGLGAGNVGAFTAPFQVPGTNNCSFGDVAIAADGTVVQTCETPSGGGQGPASIRVNRKPDGLGANPFDAGVVATATNVGGFDFVTPQNSRSVDAEPGLAFDINPASPHVGRLYLVYTDENPNESNDTDILLRFSDDNGGIWSNPPIRVNDDVGTRSQFLPKIASNPLSGNIAVCWHDCRNSGTNTAMQVFCTIATPTGAQPAFLANAQISDGASTSNGAGVEFGDYSGLAYFQGLAHPAWGDTSNSGGLNPNGTANFDAYTDQVWGGPAANEGDPHITTVDSIPYDFQSAGEFTVLREAGGNEVQTRQTAVSTNGPVHNDYTGLTTCVSLNTAVAAKVNKKRVTFQPKPNGQPDPNDLTLRIDGAVTTLPAGGLSLGGGGRVSQSAGNGIQLDFPDGTTVVVTPGFWQSYNVWYLNVDAYHSGMFEGIMGARARGSWLPALRDGTNLGPKPASLAQRFTDLFQTFADSWRVTDKASLFDYAPGTSTATFTLANWPPQNPPCVVPQTPEVHGVTLAVAEKACRRITGKFRKENCIADVRVTGNLGFAKTYELTQKLQAGATAVDVSDDRDPTKPEQPVVFTATVTRQVRVGRRETAPQGSVQFVVDGEKAGEPVHLDKNGQARWRTASLKPGEHKVAAHFVPAPKTVFLASESDEEKHTVKEGSY